MQSQTKEFKNIVIVGGGPIGMYTAIKLKNLGLNVLLVEERAHFTRPGSIDVEIFTQVGLELKEAITPSSSYHIKDLERELHKLLLKNKIEIKQGSFIKLTSSGIEIKLPSGKIEICPCDIVLDATGSKRQVIQSLNKILEDKGEEPHFKMYKVGDNPIKSHFIAYVGMDSKDAKELERKCDVLVTFDPLETRINVHTKISEKQLIDLAKLRDKFSWPYFCVPQLITFPLKKNKATLYLEIPDDLKSDQQEDWVKAVIQLIASRDIPFSYLKISDKYKFHPKPRFNKINAQVKEVRPIYFSGQDWQPLVIPIGDALLEPDYRLGIGIREGTKRVDALIQCFESKNGMVTGIDIQKYVQNADPLLESQKNMIKVLYTRRRNNLTFDPDVLLEKYIEVKSQTDKDLIFHSMIKDLPQEVKAKTCTDFANLLYKKALNEFESNVLDNKKSTIDTKKIRWNEALQESINLLSEGLKILSEAKQDKPSDILKLMGEIAVKTKDVASVFLNGDTDKKIAPKPALAKKYYMLALNIYDKHFPNEFNKEFLALCSNLVITAKKINDPNSAIYYADMAFTRLEKIPKPNPDEKKIVIKIMHNKIITLLQLSGTVSDKVKLQKMLEEINRLLEVLNSGPYQTLAQQMKAIPIAKKEEAQYNQLVELFKSIKHTSST